MANEERNWLLEFQKQLIDALKLPRDRTWFGTGLLEVVKAKVAKLEFLESVSRPDLEAVAREIVSALDGPPLKCDYCGKEVGFWPSTGMMQAHCSKSPTGNHGYTVVVDTVAYPDQGPEKIAAILRKHFPATPASTVGAQKEADRTNHTFGCPCCNATLTMNMRSMNIWHVQPAPPAPAAQPEEEK